jgi:hypothetical protein
MPRFLKMFNMMRRFYDSFPGLRGEHQRQRKKSMELGFVVPLGKSKLGKGEVLLGFSSGGYDRFIGGRKRRRRSWCGGATAC